MTKVHLKKPVLLHSENTRSLAVPNMLGGNAFLERARPGRSAWTLLGFRSPLFPTRRRARSHAHTHTHTCSHAHPLARTPARPHTRTPAHPHSSLELHRLLVNHAQRIFFQEQIQRMSSMFMHLTESKLLCQAVLFLCLVISRRFYLNGKKH